MNGKRKSIYLGVDSTQVCIFKEGHKVGLNRLLESTDGGGLEAKIRLEVLGDLSNETLEWELSDQEFSGLLVTPNLTKSDGTRLVPVRFLDTTAVYVSVMFLEVDVMGGVSSTYPVLVVWATLRATLEASWLRGLICLRGALPPVDLPG